MQYVNFSVSCYKIPKVNCSFRRKVVLSVFFHRQIFPTFLFSSESNVSLFSFQHNRKGLGISQKSILHVKDFFRKIESVYTHAMLALN